MAQAKHDSITRRSLFGALAVPIAAAPIAAAPVSIPAAPDFAHASSGLQPLPPPPDPISPPSSSIGAPCPAIHASSARSSAGGKRVLTGVAPTRGRPRPLLDFLALDIDFMINKR